MASLGHNELIPYSDSVNTWLVLMIIKYQYGTYYALIIYIQGPMDVSPHNMQAIRRSFMRIAISMHFKLTIGCRCPGTCLAPRHLQPPSWLSPSFAGISLGMCPANERHCYIVTMSHWLQAYLDWSLLCKSIEIFTVISYAVDWHTQCTK